MAQKEDILEQIVEEYLIHQGYFVQRNVKYRPDEDHPEYVTNKDSVRSDIDVLAFHPRRTGEARVLAFNIKSYQGGFSFNSVISRIESLDPTMRDRHHLKYRELCIPKWSKAFSDVIRERTGEEKFTHVLAVTFARGDKARWITNKRFRDCLPRATLKVIDLKTMIDEIEPKLTTTPAATDIGRTLQLFRAAGLRPKPSKKETSEDADSDEE